MSIFTKKKYLKVSDEKLMQKIQLGDSVAFDVLYERYSKRLLIFFFKAFGGDEQKAQDFLQDIFLKIIEKAGLFNPEKNFATWIFTIAYNLTKNEYRRMDVRKIMDYETGLEKFPEASVAGDFKDVDSKIDHINFQKALFDELKLVGEDHRLTFLLRFQQNHSIREISEIMNCSEGTVKSRLFYTTKKLAQKLNAYNPY